MQADYWSNKAIRKRMRQSAEARLPVSRPILKPRPLTPEELIDKYPAGWMCAPVRVPEKLKLALERGKRKAAKAAGRERYRRAYQRGGR